MMRQCCRHTVRTAPSEREMVLLMMNSIQSTDPLLNAHIAAISRDPLEFGANFKKTATHLMLADPVEKTQTKQKTRAPSVSATLTGRGQSTGVDLRQYPNNEFKKLSSKQKKELMNQQKTPAGLEAIKKGREAATLKRKAGSEVGNGGGSDDGVSNSKRQKKYQNSVMKQAKKLVAAAVEADDAEEEALYAKVDAAMKRIGNISFTTVAAPAAEVKVNDKAARLSSILGRITLQKKTIILPEGGK